MAIRRLKTVLKKIDAKIVSSLSSEVRSVELLTSGEKVDFSKGVSQESILEAINIYDQDILSVISRLEKRKASKVLLPGYVKLKKIVKPQLRTGLHLLRNLKSKLL